MQRIPWKSKGALALALAGALALPVEASGPASAEPEAPAEAPRLAGQAVDSGDGSPVPYANVGVPRLSAGTVSDAEGRFDLALPTGPVDDAVAIVSALGYRTRSVPLPAFPADGRIPLEPVAVAYRERVEVRAEASGDPAILGRDLEIPGYSFGFGSSLLGAEIGGRIRISDPVYVESANFVVAHTGGERFLYRVNVYEFTDGEIGQNLLRENVLVSAKQERGTLTVDLREHGLILRDDVLLALEWVADDEGKGNANVMFRARRRGRSDLYQRLTSQMPFRKVPRHAVGFYLVGWPLDARALAR